MAETILICGDTVSQHSPFKFDKQLQKIIYDANLSICNFEAPLFQTNQAKNPKAGPHIYNYSDGIKDLALSGFDLFCLANNHIFDYGQKGLEETINEISLCQKSYVGATLSCNILDALYICKIGGAKIAILNGGENQFGTLDIANRHMQKHSGYIHCFDSLFYQTLQNLKQEGDIDFIICIIHAGLEEVSVPLPQFRDLYKYLCDLGADMVVGHHPHWVQGYEVYKNKHIFYSLGNFFFNLSNKGVSSNIQQREAYSLLLSFENRKFLGFKPIFHRLEESGILAYKKENEMSFSLENLNQRLQSPNYEEEIQKIVELFYPIYQKYYREAFLICSSDDSVIKNLKTFIKKFLLRRWHSDAMLLHNIQIETHRFVQELALKTKLEKIK